MAVRADAGVGIGDDFAALVLVDPYGLRQIFQIDLVADAGAGGTTRKLSNDFCAHFRNS